jgi:hypothetical protein
MNPIYRTGCHAKTTGVTLVVIQTNPALPFERIMRACRHAFMVLAGQTDMDGRNLWPIRLYPDSCTFGGAFAKMGPGANFHTNPAFGATGGMYFNHSLSIFFL